MMTPDRSTLSRPPARQRLVAAALPGARGVWVGALVVVLVAAIFGARLLGARTASLTGTNSVDVATVVAAATPGQRVCVKDLLVPRRTARVAVSLALLKARRGARVDAVLEQAGRRMPLRQQDDASGLSFVGFSTGRPLDRDLAGAVLCVRPVRARAEFGGASVQRLPGAPVSTVDGAAIGPVDIAVRYERATGRSRTVLSAIPDAIGRANVFESGLGRALMVLALPALLLLLYVIVRIAATAEWRSPRWLFVAAVAVTFAHAASWAVLLHPFHGPDESEHFAYAQYYAATGERPDSAAGSPRSPYSSSQLRLLEALHHNSTVLNPSSRLRWEELWGRRYAAAAASSREDDGGGYTESATGHAPLYYAVVGLPGRLFGGPDDIPAVLLAMRLLNALLAALVAGLALLTAARLFNGHHGPAWLAAMLAGLQPVFGVVSGSVNNDTAVNLAAAVFVWLAVKAWQKGPTWRDAAALGATAVLLPVSKVTGFALLPVLAVVVVVVVLRHGLGRAVRFGGVVAAGGAVAVLAWAFVLSPALGAGRGALLNVHAASAPAAVTAPAAASTAPPVTLVTHAEYFLQTFVAEPTIGVDHWQLAGPTALERWPAYAIYIKRGYGLLGWKSVELSPGLLRGILLALAVGWLAALVAALQRRRRWRQWLGGVALLAASLVCVLAFISYAYTTAGVRDVDFGEQGRYVFPALVPLAVGLSAAVFAIPARVRGYGLGVAVAGTGSVALLVWTSALRGWFT